MEMMVSPCFHLAHFSTYKAIVCVCICVKHQPFTLQAVKAAYSCFSEYVGVVCAIRDFMLPKSGTAAFPPIHVGGGGSSSSFISCSAIKLLSTGSRLLFLKGQPEIQLIKTPSSDEFTFVEEKDYFQPIRHDKERVGRQTCDGGTERGKRHDCNVSRSHALQGNDFLWVSHSPSSNQLLRESYSNLLLGELYFGYISIARSPMRFGFMCFLFLLLSFYSFSRAVIIKYRMFGYLYD